MQTITTTEALAEFCAKAKAQPYVTVDTEFLRERTYWSKLCLVQLAIPPAKDGEAVLVDPLAEGLDLAPLHDLFRHEATVKVFHAARQDLEIFFVEAGLFPKPLFDTQVAAMVCGFGEQVGYETLVRKVARQQLDKTSRFTDWSRRPLTDAQKTYAIADVTHLRVIYEFLSKELRKSGREEWVHEEEEILLNPETYITRPEEAWLRVKTRTTSGRFLAVVRELARFREGYAQNKNIPRSRIFKDDALLELASTKPVNFDELNKSRLLLREAQLRLPPAAAAGGILGGHLLSLVLRHIDARRSLRRARHQADATLRSIADGVVSVDRGGDIVFMNPVAEALLGAGFAELGIDPGLRGERLDVDTFVRIANHIAGRGAGAA
jgi:ribonuclease D